MASVGAVYLSITNAGRKADLLIAVSTPIARKAEIHESRLVQGMVEMRPVASVACPPGVTVKIEPGGLHVMLLGLSSTARGRHPEFPLSLRFRDARNPDRSSPGGGGAMNGIKKDQRARH